MVIFNSILLLVLDFYIYKGLRATKLAFPKTRFFARVWWGYSVLLVASVFISIYFNIPLAFRSIILVAFFMTFVSKFIFALLLGLDDLRRGGVWLQRILFRLGGKVFSRTQDGKTDSSAAAQAPVIEAADKPLPERPVKGISRSEFLTKAGIVVAAAPLMPLSWGIISGAYNYKIRRQKIYLPNLPAAFDGIRIGQVSDID